MGRNKSLHLGEGTTGHKECVTVHVTVTLLLQLHVSMLLFNTSGIAPPRKDMHFKAHDIIEYMFCPGLTCALLPSFLLQGCAAAAAGGCA